MCVNQAILSVASFTPCLRRKGASNLQWLRRKKAFKWAYGWMGCMDGERVGRERVRTRLEQSKNRREESCVCSIREVRAREASDSTHSFRFSVRSTAKVFSSMFHLPYFPCCFSSEGYFDELSYAVTCICLLLHH